ncbi:MAG TPA: hypothetical protein VGW38_13505 [Chloroflexota bacterium]|nr:hypothetical protein [Chloroflexota bacterium]
MDTPRVITASRSRARADRQKRSTSFLPSITGFSAIHSLLFLLFAAQLVHFGTYDRWADGPQEDYARAFLVSVSLAAITWLTVRWLTPPHRLLLPVLPWFSALAVLLPGEVVHFQRLQYPAGQPLEQRISESFETAGPNATPSVNLWLTELTPGSSVAIQDGALVVRNAAGSRGYAELRLPERPRVEDGQFWLPRGFFEKPIMEEALEWEARVYLEREYYVILDTKHFLLQATPFGLHMTYPGPNGRAQEQQIDPKGMRDGAPHRYRVERADGLFRLRVDGEGVWVLPDVGYLSVVRFGESRADPLHGGWMALDNVQYIRRVLPRTRQ